MIFRDDDPSLFTRGEKFDQFVAFHEVFNRYNVLHTIAMITRDIEKNVPLIEYIKCQKNIDVQLHCVDHIDFTQNHHQVEWQLRTAADDIERIFGKRPTVFYPTWNKTDAFVDAVAGKLGLKVSWKKITLDQFIRVGGDVAEDTINMHFWHYGDQVNLEPALSLYTRKYREA
jgi:peptidoglycan/xylan/chitin deacetylase (PgdA/CDA1 family)